MIYVDVLAGLIKTRLRRMAVVQLPLQGNYDQTHAA